MADQYEELSSAMTHATIQQTIDQLRSTLTEYIEATYHIGNVAMVQQRKRLLRQVGNIFQIPYLESTPRYVSGSRYEEMSGIPDAAKEAYCRLSNSTDGASVIFNPPYLHQAEAIKKTLTDKSNLMVMTGTGSGKTESFLLPILGKLAIEARDRPSDFRNHSAVRAIVLYPMNALVNDQLGRLRLLFGSKRTISMFEEWAGRPVHFARYTSRTPYAGVRSEKKDGTRLASIGTFFAALEDAAHKKDIAAYTDDEVQRASGVLGELSAKGKWPSKESVSEWFGKGKNWRDKNGNFKRAILLPHDAELLTRHEVHENPPDVLITNYSMLEYMMLRPIERPIFDKTKEWLKACPDEKLLVVMDEAHLYRGAQGAEVGLLLRRLRERLGIGPERLQVICSTASFADTANAGQFGSQLTGVPVESFAPVKGTLDLRKPASVGNATDIDALATVDLERFYSSDPVEQMASVGRFLDFRGVPSSGGVEPALHQALKDYAPFNLLVNATMKSALPLEDLGNLAFGVAGSASNIAITALLAMGSRARLKADSPSLLPCRIHTFFRGLPGLWVCMDPECTELEATEAGGPAGKMYSQPRDRCGCGACVLEYFTCRDCGTSYARAYTSDVLNPRLTWNMPGIPIEGIAEALQPLDLLLEEPRTEMTGRVAVFDLINGQINPDTSNTRKRTVYLAPKIGTMQPDDEEDGKKPQSPGVFMPCGCCLSPPSYGKSSVQDHQTKGDQPFQALLSMQVRIQPPGPQPASDFAPLRGRKVLIFSDSRQTAAKLSPMIQNYSLSDTVRALVPAGFGMLAEPQAYGVKVNLDHAFPAVLTAANRFRIRIRPVFMTGEMMPDINDETPGSAITKDGLNEIAGASCPEKLLEAILKTLRDRHLGLEALAVASIREVSKLTPKILQLPSLPGLAETNAEKLEVARGWLRCWFRPRGPGVWFQGMPNAWWGTKIKTHKGKFDPMSQKILKGPGVAKLFEKSWHPALMQSFTNQSQDGGIRLLAKNLTLEMGGDWRRCTTCSSVHRPISRLTTCIDCASDAIEAFDPDTDMVFEARKGFYRRPVVAAMTSDDPNLMTLIAAEHTAQLNAAQTDDAFSLAEDHEIRFQDIDLTWRDGLRSEPAIDVLSSTTTMEVGIDIGALSGVALRNMPPGRSNYQQRAGRAGRRGNAVATVIAFGRVDSHDDHYFVKPDEMIRGPVIDPRLTLENVDIARRHVRAFLLQRYSEDSITGVDPLTNANLFSVLGKVKDFRADGVLNRENFAKWLKVNGTVLHAALERWLPTQLSKVDRQRLIDEMDVDILAQVDEATEYVGPDVNSGDVVVPGGSPLDSENEDDGVADNEIAMSKEDTVDPGNDNLLDRLLYKGVLPRYAFPTDVASFHVFNDILSTPFRVKLLFAPSQGLNIALSQYAPNKQVWINNKQYTSKAVYSPFKGDIKNAWKKRRLYYECTYCGHSKTEDFVREKQGEIKACEACASASTFGPARNWMRPPGFAHPTRQEATHEADDQSETAYATRAKLVMSTPAPAGSWVNVNHSLRAYPTRTRLLVSNSGPGEKGYIYCTSCGRIESKKDPEMDLRKPHAVPYPNSDDDQCQGTYVSSKGIVLGTDFIADICLFSIRVERPFWLRPGREETETALRTVCEAVAKAACSMLDIEDGEILAEFRPALTVEGAAGSEIEIFLYDTLSGGAGFSPQLAHRGHELFVWALKILSHCPEGCDGSCYRCLRSFKNKFDHYLLDRQLGEQLLRHALYGGIPEYSPGRAKISLDILCADLNRQLSATFLFSRSVMRQSSLGEVNIPILSKQISTGEEKWIDLSSPIVRDTPICPELRHFKGAELKRLICVDDLLVRRNLATAVLCVTRELN